MTKKPPKKAQKPAAKDAPLPFSAHSMESLMADIGRLLDEQEFESIDEANAYLQALTLSGQPIAPATPRTPLEEAQMIMYEAWEAPTRRRAVKLARKALSISEDCADAYVLLAEATTDSLAEAKALYTAGVEAGERALGKQAFVDYKGNFWAILETRPYMRARAGLAECLWILGHRDEAIAHYEAMLRLNPGDNQGLRHILLPRLLEEGRDKDAERLLKAYGREPTAMWLYTGALMLFKKEGPSRRATRKLQQGLEANPYVPDYLLARRPVPRDLPPYLQMGGDSEAAYYVLDAAHLWVGQDGALDWLLQVSTDFG